MRLLKDSVDYRSEGDISLSGLFNNSLEIEILTRFLARRISKNIDLKKISTYDWMKLNSLNFPNYNPEKFNKTKEIFDNIDDGIKKDYSLDLMDDMIYFSFHAKANRKDPRKRPYVDKKYGIPIGYELSENENHSLFQLHDGTYALDDGMKSLYIDNLEDAILNNELFNNGDITYIK